MKSALYEIDGGDARRGSTGSLAGGSEGQTSSVGSLRGSRPRVRATHPPRPCTNSHHHFAVGSVRRQHCSSGHRIHGDYEPESDHMFYRTKTIRASRYAKGNTTASTKALNGVVSASTVRGRERGEIRFRKGSDCSAAISRGTHRSETE
jgi:hypothetical protein